MSDVKYSTFDELVKHYRHRMEECSSLLENATIKIVSFLREDLETLLNLAELAVTILHEETQENKQDTPRLIEKWDKSRFSPKALTYHFNVIKDNLAKVDGYITHARSEGIEIKLEEPIQTSSSDETIFSFTFNVSAFKSEELQHAYNCLSDDDFLTKSPYEPKVEDPMQKINEREHIPHSFDLFVLYFKENSRESNKKFVISSAASPTDSMAYTSVFTSQGETPFEFPGKPGKPLYVENSKTDSSLRLTLVPAAAGINFVTGFKVMIFEVGNLIRTMEVQKNEIEPNEFLVEDLKQGMEYSFKVQSISLAGFSPKSAMSEKVTIDSGVTFKSSRIIRLSSSTALEA